MQTRQATPSRIARHGQQNVSIGFFLDKEKRSNHFLHYSSCSLFKVYVRPLRRPSSSLCLLFDPYKWKCIVLNVVSVSRESDRKRIGLIISFGVFTSIILANGTEKISILRFCTPRKCTKDCRRWKWSSSVELSSTTFIKNLQTKKVRTINDCDWFVENISYRLSFRMRL